MRWILALAAGTVVVTVAVLAVFDRELSPSGTCVAQVGQTRVEVDLEQAQWTSLIAALSYERDLPPRATTIAIATAYQESKIHNIDYGDRDSVGLFQQRPSQGWGTVEQIMDPFYSIGKFYEGLVAIGDYESMEITDAAQAVQRSAFPLAYAQHEANARALASALRGYSPAAFACQIDRPDELDADGLADYLDQAWGGVRVETQENRQVIALSGEQVEVRGWALAQFLVANAARFGVSEVTFDDMRWRAGANEPVWVPTQDASHTEIWFR